MDDLFDPGPAWTMQTIPRMVQDVSERTEQTIISILDSDESFNDE